MHMLLFLLLLLLMHMIYVNGLGAKIDHFAYEPGKCEVIISSAFQELIRAEMRALVEPSLRAPYCEKRLRYDLYTRLNPYQRQELRTGDEAALLRSYFNPEWPVRFSIHGWIGKSTSCSNAAVKDAYLERGDFNVIIIDWSAHSMDVSYKRVSKQMLAMAATLVDFMQFLHKKTGVAYSEMYVIGHSAGAHIAGLAGKLLRANTQQQLGVIYAIDPAGLTQRNWPPEQRLTYDDALYVESIHSDTTLLGNPSVTLSQVAFFANWAQGQPHCLNLTAAEFDLACDHFGSLYYFAESVRNARAFGALQCTIQPITTTTTTTTPTTTETITTDNTNMVLVETNFSSSSSLSTSSSRSLASLNCICDSITSQCAAQVFMGGEPAIMTKPRGVYYFSTMARQPYGRGDTVLVQPVIPSTIANSRLSQLYNFIRA